MYRLIYEGKRQYIHEVGAGNKGVVGNRVVGNRVVGSRVVGDRSIEQKVEQGLSCNTHKP